MRFICLLIWTYISQSIHFFDKILSALFLEGIAFFVSVLNQLKYVFFSKSIP